MIASVLVVQQPVAHADVHAFVGRGAEYHAFQSRMGRTEGKSVGNAGFQCHLPPRRTGEEVAEEEVQVVALVGGLRETLAVHFLLGFHQAEADPGVRALYKLPEDFEVDACGVSRGDVASVVYDFYVVHIVRNQVAQGFVIDFRGEFERTVHELEFVVATQYDLERTL